MRDHLGNLLRRALVQVQTHIGIAVAELPMTSGNT